MMAIAHRGKRVSEYAFGHANCFGSSLRTSGACSCSGDRPVKSH
jgi:hypothetical protein